MNNANKGDYIWIGDELMGIDAVTMGCNITHRELVRYIRDNHIWAINDHTVMIAKPDEDIVYDLSTQETYHYVDSASYLYDDIGIGSINNDTVERIMRDYDNGYLTVNKGRDGKMYLWYFDDNHDACYDIEERETINDSEFIERNFA